MTSWAFNGSSDVAVTNPSTRKALGEEPRPEQDPRSGRTTSSGPPGSPDRKNVAGETPISSPFHPPAGHWILPRPMSAVTTWIGIPLLGGLIGYVTNRIAVKMIFRPLKPWNVLGIRVQGLLPRRQAELAESVGKVVGEHLVQHRDIVRAFDKVDFEGLLRDVLDRALEPKLEEFRSLPLIGGFLTEERIGQIRDGIARGVIEHKAVVLEKLEAALERGLDVEELVAEKIAGFRIEKLETIVLSIASKELRAIEVLGAVLGILIGIVQVLLVQGVS